MSEANWKHRRKEKGAYGKEMCSVFHPSIVVGTWFVCLFVCLFCLFCLFCFVCFCFCFVLFVLFCFVLFCFVLFVFFFLFFFFCLENAMLLLKFGQALEFFGCKQMAEVRYLQSLVLDPNSSCVDAYALFLESMDDARSAEAFRRRFDQLVQLHRKSSTQ